MTIMGEAVLTEEVLLLRLAICSAGGCCFCLISVIQNESQEGPAPDPTPWTLLPDSGDVVMKVN